MCKSIWDDVIIQLSCKFGTSAINTFWVIMLTISSGNNYVINKHEALGQYHTYAIPSKLCYTCPVSLVNLFDKLNDLSC